MLKPNSQATFFIILAALAMATVALSVKNLSLIIPALTLFWLTRFFPLLSLPHIKLRDLKTKRWPWHLLLSLCYLSSIACYFSALEFTSLTRASALFNTAPLYVPLLTRQTKLPWGFMLLSILGILMLHYPKALLIPSFVATLSGFLMAAALTCNNYLVKHDSKESLLFYQLTLAPLLAILFFLIRPFPTLNWTPSLILPILLAGVATWIYQLSRAKAAQGKNPSLVMTLSHLSIVFSGCFDYLFWDTISAPTTLFGAALILIANGFIHKKATKAIPYI